MPEIPTWSPAVAAAVALAVLWAGEGLFPLLADQKGTLRRRFVNLGVGAIGYGIAAIVLSAATLGVTFWAAAEGFGLLHWVEWTWPVEWLVAFLILDFWAYVWHVAAHKWRFLWRFHVVHHHDEQVDSTTAFRFHAVEIVGKGATTLALLAAAGISIEQLLLVETVTVINVVFHHGNLFLPRWVEVPLRGLLVTPAVHLVHHSRWQPETDSNFGAVLSIWDRIFGTFRVRRDPTKIEFGLDGYEAEEVHTVWGMLRTPFGPIKSEHGKTPAAFLDGTETPRPGDRIDGVADDPTVDETDAGDGLPLVETPAPARTPVEAGT